jgi:hypothetical protein
VTSCAAALKTTTKNRPGKNPQAGITLSPACLATYLTWLQAGRLKSPRNSFLPNPARAIRQANELTFAMGLPQIPDANAIALPSAIG